MSVIAPGRNIVIIGLMAAGKSTVGRLLAQRLGRPFVDTDKVVVDEAGASVAEIFAAQGERAFRALEAAAVRQVAALRGQVISVGGGAVLDPGNVTHLRATGDIVLLDADPAEIAARVRNPAKRPLLAESADVVATLTELRDARAAAYRSAATHIVDTKGMDSAAVAAVLEQWAHRTPGLLSKDEL